jgi:hypothetical protein
LSSSTRTPPIPWLAFYLLWTVVVLPAAYVVGARDPLVLVGLFLAGAPVMIGVAWLWYVVRG